MLFRSVHHTARFQVKSEEQIEPAVVEFREESPAQPVERKRRFEDQKDGGFSGKRRFDDRKSGGFGQAGFGGKRPWQRRDDRRGGGFVDRHSGGAGIIPAGTVDAKPAFPGLKKRFDRPYAKQHSGKPRWKT